MTRPLPSTPDGESGRSCRDARSELSTAEAPAAEHIPVRAIPARVARRPRRFAGVWSQAAAAVLIAIGGVAYGRYTAAGSALPVSLAADSISFSSVGEARAAQERYQTLYQSAALYLAAHDTLELSPDSPAAMRHRLATLDEVEGTVRQALNESPGDPVINGYYLTTLGQREVTLRQLNASLPAGMRVNRF